MCVLPWVGYMGYLLFTPADKLPGMKSPEMRRLDRHEEKIAKQKKYVLNHSELNEDAFDYLLAEGYPFDKIMKYRGDIDKLKEEV